MVVGLLDRSGSRVFGAGKLDNGRDPLVDGPLVEGQLVDGDTIFEIGSVTKVFTALLALEMDRRGEVKLDGPVGKYLPERVKVPAYEGKEITLRHLAAQDSGLPFHPDSIEKILDWASGKPRLKEFKFEGDRSGQVRFGVRSAARVARTDGIIE